MGVSVDEVRQFLSKRDEERRRRCSALHNKALADVEKIVAYMKANYPLVSLYQWGSVLYGESFDELSDIDIALEGVASPEDFFKIYKDLENLTDFSLDIIELDRTDPISRASILERGIKIYGP